MSDGSNISSIPGQPSATLSTAPRRSRSERWAPSHLHLDYWIDPVEGGLVTGAEYRAWVKYRKALRAAYDGRKPVDGPADFRALHCAALFNYSEPCVDRIYCDSVRYCWLLAHHEIEWAYQRTNKRLTKTEKAATALIKACHTLADADKDYKPYSRFTRTLALEWRDQHAYDENVGIDRSERRRLLLDARARQTAALRKLLPLIDAYKAVHQLPLKADRALLAA